MSGSLVGDTILEHLGVPPSVTDEGILNTQSSHPNIGDHVIQISNLPIKKDMETLFDKLEDRYKAGVEGKMT